VLVLMAYAYLLSAFVGMAVTRFKHRGHPVPSAAGADPNVQPGDHRGSRGSAAS